MLITGCRVVCSGSDRVVLFAGRKFDAGVCRLRRPQSTPAPPCIYPLVFTYIMRAPSNRLRRYYVGHQAHAQSHADHGHADEALVEKSENGCADAGAALALIGIALLTALFWLAGHAS